MQVKDEHFANADWRMAGCSIVGHSHLDRGEECDDNFAWAQVADWMVAVVSDGAGSAPHGDRGSSLASRLVSNQIAYDLARTHARSPDDPEIAEIVTLALSDTREVIEAFAGLHDDALRDYGHTIVGAVMRGRRALFFHIGDGAAIAMQRHGKDRWALAAHSMPRNGEFANATYFLTENGWRQQLQLASVEDFDTILMMTDGLTPFALDRGQAEPDPNFVIGVVDDLNDLDSGAAQKSIRRLLMRDKIAMGDGDDKTLLWASNTGDARAAAGLSDPRYGDAER